MPRKRSTCGDGGGAQTVKAHPKQIVAADITSLRAEISGEVCAAATRMVQATIEQASTGHYQAMRCLFEMIGLFPATVLPEGPESDSLVGTLLDHLGISRNGESAAGVQD